MSYTFETGNYRAWQLGHIAAIEAIDHRPPGHRRIANLPLFGQRRAAIQSEGDLLDIDALVVRQPSAQRSQCRLATSKRRKRPLVIAKQTSELSDAQRPPHITHRDLVIVWILLVQLRDHRGSLINLAPTFVIEAWELSHRRRTHLLQHPGNGVKCALQVGACPLLGCLDPRFDFAARPFDDKRQRDGTEHQQRHAGRERRMPMGPPGSARQRSDRSCQHGAMLQEPLQVVGKRLGRRVATSRIPIAGDRNDRRDVTRHLRVGRAQRRRIATQDLLAQSMFGPSMKRRPQHQQFVQRHTERVDIRARVDLTFLQLVQRAKHGATARDARCTCGRGQTKVEQQHAAIYGHHRVVRLQVAMDDTTLVRMVRSPRHLRDDATTGHHPSPGEQFRQLTRQRLLAARSRDHRKVTALPFISGFAVHRGNHFAYLYLRRIGRP